MWHWFPDPAAFFETGWVVATHHTLRGIFVTLDAALFLLLIWVVEKGIRFRPKVHPAHGQPKKTVVLRDVMLKDRWNDVMSKATSGKEDGMKLAIIEADKVVDDTLKEMGLPGEHVADRLQNIPPEEVRTLPRLWRAHRLRNNIVHTPGFFVTPDQAKQAIADYEAFLKEIGLFGPQGGHH